MRKFSVFIFSLFIACLQFSQAQTTNGSFTVDNVTPPFNNVATLIQNVLVSGSTINVTNITYTWGGPEQVGYFSDVTPTPGYMGIPSGIVLSTGGINYAIGAPGAGGGTSYTDPDITAALPVFMQGFSQNNTVIVEFDFVSPSEWIEFWYVFASREFQGFTCSNFNDMFGFFVSGPNPNNPLTPYSGFNIARVPADPNQTSFTNFPVMINTINSGSPSGTNSAPCDNIMPDWEDNYIFWADNVNGTELPNFTGMTKPLRAYLPVICDSTYHMKLAICDLSDGALNSAVFLQESSFRSPVNVTVEDTTNVSSQDSTGFFYEGCGTASLTFKRPPDWDFAPGTGDLPIFFELIGTADYLDDYVFINNPWEDHFIIPNWDSTFTLEMQINQDFLVENTEEITIRVWHLAGGSCHDDGFYDFTFTISDYEFVELDLDDQIISHCPGDQVDFEVGITGGIPEIDADGEPYYDLHWSHIGFNEEQTVYPDSSQWYYVYVKDQCPHYTAVDSIWVEVMQYDELLANPLQDIYICENVPFDTIFPIDSISGGDGNYTFVWQDLTEAWTDTGLHLSLDAGIYQLEVIDGCDNHAFAEFEVFHYEIPETDIIITEMPVELRHKFKGFEEPNNHNVPYMNMKYIWDFGDGSPLFYGKTAVHDYPYYGDFDVRLTMENEKGCVKTFDKVLKLRPTYFAPTIFSPNGDGLNEGFKVSTTRKHEEFTMRIYDRWGQEVFHTEDINDPWFGFYKDGSEAQGGAYVFKVEIKYLNFEDVVEHNGVFTLMR